MRKLLIMMLVLPLFGCSASIGTPPSTTTTYTTATPVVRSTTYTATPTATAQTTVTKTTY